MLIYLTNHIIKLTRKIQYSIYNLDNNNIYRFQVDSDCYLQTFEDDTDVDWDQFETNEKKFNVQSSYQETDYTTVLINEFIPKKIREKAERIASVLKKVNNSRN